MKNVFILMLLSISLLSCQNNDNKIKEVERAFYYWKGDSYIDREDISQLKKLKTKKLYVKLFEVDYSESRGNFPYDKNRPNYYYFKEIDSVKIVPTIFIKNEIFEFNDEKSLDKLADNIVFLINKYSLEESYNSVQKVFDYEEIQIDCDWTKSSKEKYFYLLKKIKELSKKNISCTLRLYPYKYPDIMGVPPVDKATLMCYNLIKPLSQKDKNSILDIDELKKYLNEKRSYPVHLDIALPTFYWTQLYQNNHFMKLMELSPKEVKSFARLVKPLWYQVEKDTSINYYTYLKAGDQLKCEDVQAEIIYKAIEIIKKNVDLDKNTTISLFDLDKSTFKQYSNEEISNFYNNFAK